MDDIEEDLDIREGAKCIVAAWDGKVDQRLLQKPSIPNSLSEISVNIQSPQIGVSPSFVQVDSNQKPKSSRFAKLTQKLGNRNLGSNVQRPKGVFIQFKPQKIKGESFASSAPNMDRF